MSAEKHLQGPAWLFPSVTEAIFRKKNLLEVHSGNDLIMMMYFTYQRKDDHYSQTIDELLTCYCCCGKTKEEKETSIPKIKMCVQQLLATPHLTSSCLCKGQGSFKAPVHKANGEERPVYYLSVISLHGSIRVCDAPYKNTLMSA